MTTTIEEILKQIKLIKNNEELEKEEKNIKIKEIIDKTNTPIKEYLTISSDFNKYYTVYKERRDFLIKNYNTIIENNLFNNNEKNKIKCALLDAYNKNYEYILAENIANNLYESNSNDYILLYQLGEYYIYTRRYDLAKNILSRALLICEDNDFKELINKKLIECMNRELGREKGGMLPYLPGRDEGKNKYKELMDHLGIEIELPIKRPKAPEKIEITNYPEPIELTKSGFKSFVAFDVETTGIDHNRDSITELAAIRVVDGKIVETKDFIFQELVHPYKKRIPKNVEELTGITNEMTYNCREIWEVFKDFSDWLQDDILVGYNCMTFDSKFMSRAGRLSNIIINNKYFDVMHYVKNFSNELNYKSKTLTNIGELLEIKNPNAHRALADAITTAKVYLALLELENNKK